MMQFVPPGSHCVLVADDEPQLLRGLEKSGYPVVTASDAPNALSAFPPSALLRAIEDSLIKEDE